MVREPLAVVALVVTNGTVTKRAVEVLDGVGDGVGVGVADAAGEGLGVGVAVGLGVGDGVGVLPPPPLVPPEEGALHWAYKVIFVGGI